MTFSTTFDNWQTNPPAHHGTCSANLRLVAAELQRRFGVHANHELAGARLITNLGCYGRRPVRGGGAISSHSYGAAIDVGYPADLDVEVVQGQMIPFLVAWSLELHVQAIHDYRRCRIWRAGRTPHEGDACDGWWKAQRRDATTGMGQPWANHLHIETSGHGWPDATPIADRGVT